MRLLTKTFLRYPNHYNNLNIWKTANNEGVFHLKFHAREHLNVSKFIISLQKNDSDVHFGFTNKMPGCVKRINMKLKICMLRLLCITLRKIKNKSCQPIWMVYHFSKKHLAISRWLYLQTIPGAPISIPQFQKVEFALQGIRKYREPVVDSNELYFTIYGKKRILMD